MGRYWYAGETLPPTTPEVSMAKKIRTPQGSKRDRATKRAQSILGPDYVFMAGSARILRTA